MSKLSEPRFVLSLQCWYDHGCGELQLCGLVFSHQTLLPERTRSVLQALDITRNWTTGSSFWGSILLKMKARTGRRTETGLAGFRGLSQRLTSETHAVPPHRWSLERESFDRTCFTFTPFCSRRVLLVLRGPCVSQYFLFYRKEFGTTLWSASSCHVRIFFQSCFRE